MVGEADDARVILRLAAVVPELELLEADHPGAAAGEPVGSGAADATEPEHDDVRLVHAHVGARYRPGRCKHTTVDELLCTLSVLDQSPIAEGSTGAQALRNTIDLAQLTESLGYHRYWVAEHHATGMLAGASPEVLLAAIGAATTHMRIGSGGVMLPHYSPLKVAETFSVLSGLYGDRIDLGIGRAPDTDPATAFALQRDRRVHGHRRLPGAARRADRVPAGELPARATRSPGSR